MKVETYLFGAVEVSPEKVIEFPNGLVGFEQNKRFMLAHEDGTAQPSSYTLQSLDDPNLAFQIVDPVTLGFNYELIMYMHDNGARAERLHGVTENISCGGLNNVFHKFGTIGIEPFPFLCPTDTFVGNAAAAELVFTDAGLHIGEASTGRERNEQETALIGEANTMRYSHCFLPDRRHCGTVNVPPELHNMRV